MLLPILPWYDVYLLISGLVAPSPLLPILATDQRKPDTTQTYTKHASESNVASIHKNSRFHSAPQTYNKQQACIRIQHISNPCCTISARWKEGRVKLVLPPRSRCKLSTMCCKSEIRCNSCKDRTRAYSWVFMNQILSLDTYTLCIWYMNIGVLFFDDAHYFKSSK